MEISNYLIKSNVGDTNLWYNPVTNYVMVLKKAIENIGTSKWMLI